MIHLYFVPKVPNISSHYFCQLAYKVIIADDHPLIIEGYKQVLNEIEDLVLVGMAYDGCQALDILKSKEPDLLLLDIMMPRMNGLQVLERMQHEGIKTDVIVVTVANDINIYRQIRKYGAKGYLLKYADQQEFEMAIRKIRAGKNYYSSEIFEDQRENDMNEALNANSLKGLTDREREVLSCIAEGLTNKEIAVKLYISPKTVDTHRMNLMKKIDVHNVAGLVKYAVSNGFCRTSLPT